jgi:hypothetical protein
MPSMPAASAAQRGQQQQEEGDSAAQAAESAALSLSQGEAEPAESLTGPDCMWRRLEGGQLSFNVSYINPQVCERGGGGRKPEKARGRGGGGVEQVQGRNEGRTGAGEKGDISSPDWV